MPYDIIIGRSAKDRKKFGKKGAIFLGKQYVKMGQITSLSNPIFINVTTSHVIFVCGKRGSGKSYTMGVIAEGMADLEPEISQNLSIIMLDTMGIYWTMKYPNHEQEDRDRCPSHGNSSHVLHDASRTIAVHSEHELLLLHRIARRRGVQVIPAAVLSLLCC